MWPGLQVPSSLLVEREIGKAEEEESKAIKLELTTKSGQTAAKSQEDLCLFFFFFSHQVE